MHCNQSQQKLSEYLDGQLPEEERNQLEDHIQECEDCRRELDSLRRTVTALHELPEIPAPEGFHERINQRLRDETKGARVVSMWRRGLAVAASFIAIMTLVFLVNDGIVHRGYSGAKSPAPSQLQGGPELAKTSETKETEAKLKRKKRPESVKTMDVAAARRENVERKPAPEAGPHQMMAVPPKKKDGQVEQMLALADRAGLNEARIQVKKNGKKVITLRMSRDSYEKFLRSMARTQDASTRLKNTGVTRNNAYFDRLVQQYNQAAPVSATHEVAKAEADEDGKQIGKRRRLEEERSEGMSAERSMDRKKKKGDKRLRAASAPAGVSARNVTGKEQVEAEEEKVEKKKQSKTLETFDTSQTPEEIVLRIEIMPSVRSDPASKQEPAADSAPGPSY